MRRVRSAAGAIAAVAAGLALAPPAARAAAPVEIPLIVHVAVGADGAPVADPAWLADEVATATARLGGAEVSFVAAGGAADGVPAAIDDVAGRDALADRVDDRAVHVFVVARVADKDQPDAVIGGVTWRAGGRAYIVIAHDDARDDTLAHELGHFFGLDHTRAADDLMTPRREPGGQLTAAQVTVVRRRVAAWARAHRRRAAPTP